jgi:4-amino-4-deoxy-L-arabinose transferase-like glycosyltransferase
MGVAVAIRLNDWGEKWPAALVGWATGWFFALIALAAWQVTHGRPVLGRPCPGQPRWRRSEFIVLAVVLLAAAFLRVVAIESYPVALHNDEMSCLIEARGFLGGSPGVFGVGWFNCPNLGFFLTSLPLRVLGQTLLALRLSSALLGLLSLIAIYLLVRRLFGVRPAMLLLIMTTPFHWHLHFSRTGFHYMQAASLTAVAIWLFVLAVDRRSPVLFGCAGVVTGIACQTYYAAWLIPIILVAWAIDRALSDRERGKTAVKGLVVTIAFLVVTMAPLLAYYTEDSEYATSRPNAVFLFSEFNTQHLAHAYGTNNPGWLLVENARRLGGFFVGGFGDSAIQYGFQHQFIDPFLLPLFLCGLAYSLTLVRKPGGQLLWTWFLGTLIAGCMLTIDAPFSPRLIGIAPIVLLFPALLIDWILSHRWIGARRWLSAGVTVAVAVLIVGSAWWNLQMTFVRYPKEHYYHARDYIVRLALELKWVRTIANLQVPEEFDHESYRALIPHIKRTNVDTWSTPYDSPADLINSFGSRTLIIVSLRDTAFLELCQEMDAKRTGTVIARNGSDGFQWCYLE